MRKQRFGVVPRAARLDHQVVPVTGWESLIAKTVLVAEQGDTAVGRDPLGCLAGAADHTGWQVGRWREASGGTRGTSDRESGRQCWQGRFAPLGWADTGVLRGPWAPPVTEGRPPAAGSGRRRSRPSRRKDFRWASRRRGTPGPRQEGRGAGAVDSGGWLGCAVMTLRGSRRPGQGTRRQRVPAPVGVGGHRGGRALEAADVGFLGGPLGGAGKGGRGRDGEGMLTWGEPL